MASGTGLRPDPAAPPTEPTVTPRDLGPRRHVLFTTLTACAWRDTPAGPRPSHPATAQRLPSFSDLRIL